MAVHFDPKTLFPEEYIIEEDLAEMGDSRPHLNLMVYLYLLLQWYYRQEKWLVLANMNVYHPLIRNSQHYVVPDIAVIKIVLPPEEEASLKSWNALRHVPEVVFEISSPGTWQHDVEDSDRDKPALYGRLGVKEYYAYDPNPTPVWADGEEARLRGWVYQNGQPVELSRGKGGRLWSKELDSYLVPQGGLIRLTDRKGKRRLTEQEADRLAVRQAEQARQQAERTARQAEQARSQADQRTAELERQLAELRRQTGIEE